ncbi:hypothetical protein PSEHALCIP103_03165 [Pseudoalteromonas haloplanktis]|uniref:Uncharacterized protein n=1 Tax=Pseudoalteromonas haloplanktis TaxID=228 RepID=A0A9W4R2R0_PSEHA|nr:hypothetical protein PSEHALCIP103_03165 [Pseudoalteromonas haloplanktis]
MMSNEIKILITSAPLKKEFFSLMDNIFLPQLVKV